MGLCLYAFSVKPLPLLLGLCQYAFAVGPSLILLSLGQYAFAIEAFAFEKEDILAGNQL